MHHCIIEYTSSQLQCFKMPYAIFPPARGFGVGSAICIQPPTKHACDTHAPLANAGWVKQLVTKCTCQYVVRAAARSASSEGKCIFYGF